MGRLDNLGSNPKHNTMSSSERNIFTSAFDGYPRPTLCNTWGGMRFIWPRMQAASVWFHHQDHFVNPATHNSLCDEHN